MKRTIRSLILAGVMSLLMMSSGTQPAQAGKSSSLAAATDNYYVGYIYLRPQFVMSGGGGYQKYIWISQGTIRLFYDGTGTGGDDAKITLNKFVITYTVYGPQNGECPAGAINAVALANYTGGESTRFYPDGAYFSIPGTIGKARWLEKSVTVFGPGSCGVGEAGSWNSWWPEADAYSAMMKTLKLFVDPDPDRRSLQGSCFFQNWDEASSGPYVFSTNCNWFAVKVTRAPKDWRKIERLTPLKP